MSLESELKPKLDELLRDIPEGVDTTKLRQSIDGLLSRLREIDGNILEPSKIPRIQVIALRRNKKSGKV